MRQRGADRSGTPLVVQRVRQGHADLRHAVPFEQCMAGDLAPALEDGHRQRGRSRHHEAKPPAPLTSGPSHRTWRRVPGLDQPVVDRRDRGEHGHVTRREPGPDGFSVEARKHLARRAAPQRRRQDVDDAVDVMQRQDQQRPVIGLPLPGLDQRRDLGAQIGVRQHDALRPSCRAAGVEHQRAPARRRMDFAFGIRGGLQELGRRRGRDAARVRH